MNTASDTHERCERKTGNDHRDFVFAFGHGKVSSYPRTDKCETKLLRTPSATREAIINFIKTALDGK